MIERPRRYTAFVFDRARRRSVTPVDLSRGEIARLPTTAAIVVVRAHDQTLQQIVIADTLSPFLDEYESRRRDHRAGIARTFVSGVDLRALVDSETRKHSFNLSTDFPATERLVIGRPEAPDLDFMWYYSDDDLRRQGRGGYVLPRVADPIPRNADTLPALHVIICRRRGLSLSVTYWPARTEGARIDEVLGRALEAYSALPLGREAPPLRIEERRPRRFAVPEPAARYDSPPVGTVLFSEVREDLDLRQPRSALVTASDRSTHFDVLAISRSSALLTNPTRDGRLKQDAVDRWLGRYFECEDRQAAISGLMRSLKPGQAVHIRGTDGVHTDENLTWLTMRPSDESWRGGYIIPIENVKAPLSLGDVGLRTWLMMKARSGEAAAFEYWIPTRGNATARLFDLIKPLEDIAQGCKAPVDFRIVDPAAETVRTQWRCDESVKRLLDVAEACLPPARMDEAEQDELVRRLGSPPAVRGRLKQELAVRRVSAQELLRRRDGLRWLSLIIAEMEVEAGTASTDRGPAVFGAAITSFLRACATEAPRTSHEERARVVNLVYEWISRKQTRPYPNRSTLDMSRVSATMDRRLRALAAEAPWVALFRERLHEGFDWKVAVDEAVLVEALAIARPPPTAATRASPARDGQHRGRPSGFTVSALRDHFELTIRGEELRLGAADGWLSALAGAAGILYFRPGEAARDLAGSGAPREIVVAGTEVAARLSSREAGTLNDLVVLADRPDQCDTVTIMAINTSPTARLAVSVGADIERWLGPRAIGTPGVTDYVSDPIQVNAEASPAIRVGGKRMDVEVRPRGSITVSQASTEWLAPELFRGRARELARLTTPMATPAGPRIPCAIYGTRRAGKTTLAIHSCRTGIDGGLLRGWFKIDMSTVHRGGATDEHGYLVNLGVELARQATATLGLTLAQRRDDPIDVLRELDDLLDDSGRPFGIVLDEFDFLLSRAPESMLQTLASRLGAMHWKNLVMIATVQRFYQRASELKNWSLIHCPPDLSWEAGVTYFCEYLDPARPDRAPVATIQTPVVTPAVFKEQVAARVGYRPYFWGQLRARLEGDLLVDPTKPAFADRVFVSQTIDQIVLEDTYLALPIQPTPGLSVSECRRRDLFSEQEKRVLACLLFENDGQVPLERAAQVGGPEAVQELLERAYLVETRDETLLTAVPIFLEALNARRADFLPFRPSRSVGTPR